MRNAQISQPPRLQMMLKLGDSLSEMPALGKTNGVARKSFGRASEVRSEYSVTQRAL